MKKRYQSETKYISTATLAPSSTTFHHFHYFLCIFDILYSIFQDMDFMDISSSLDTVQEEQTLFQRDIGEGKGEEEEAASEKEQQQQ